MLGSGAVYGALEMYTGAVSPAALVARDVTRLLTVPQARYMALVADHPGFADWVLRAVAAQRA